MTPGELLIIYLAAGAPFGVYSAFNEYDHTGRVSMVSLAFKFLVWPVFVCLIVGRQISANLHDKAAEAPNSYDIPTETAELRRDITSTVVFENINQRRRLMDEFERFAGITAAVSEADRGRKPSIPLILEATGHTTPNLGAKCIFRRNHARLLEHRNRALEDLVFELRRTRTNGGPFTIDELTERAREIAAPRERRDDRESWRTASPSTSGPLHGKDANSFH